ncbi:hypothetical protein ACDY96_27185 [Rhizobium mongolense]|uniref:Uncharacterized protein n=1 Tax=Rhizobium gallicum TaxID=56730 RepID=A0A1L5NTR9_9HYPH|nr:MULTISPECIES: hypothetical protein [Rhizobium]APO71259.1 hypothetical protein IE4872_PD00729 [Rhizobium gallicum]QPB23445.1 hypothetical protein ISN39_28560 [Rhizobium sp. 007]ULJ75261.1 hypothetical protein L2W42_34010 [Rhizobium gallicum]WFU91475.1 hypothetical protein QA644_25310 [Rhizobium sp. CC1099]
MKDDGSTRGKSGWSVAAVVIVIALAALLHVYGQLLSGDSEQLTRSLREAAATADGG